MHRKSKAAVWISAAALVCAGVITAVLIWGRFPGLPGVQPESGRAASEHSQTVKTTAATSAATVETTTVTAASPTAAAPTRPQTTTPPSGVYIQKAGAPWNLLLVNSWNPMDKAYYQDTYKHHIVNYKTGGQVDDRVSKSLEEMLEAAKDTGLRAGYLFRTPERSASNLENKINDYMKKGYSREEARKKALETIAAPYTSEHNLGLAIDMIQNGDWSLRESFDQTAAFAWLQEHCAEYGFIIRYPKEKQAITGVSYEPWHYRYVGREHAEEIMRRHLTLEEYLQEKG